MTSDNDIFSSPDSLAVSENGAMDSEVKEKEVSGTKAQMGSEEH